MEVAPAAVRSLPEGVQGVDGLIARAWERVDALALFSDWCARHELLSGMARRGQAPLSSRLKALRS